MNIEQAKEFFGKEMKPEVILYNSSVDSKAVFKINGYQFVVSLEDFKSLLVNKNEDALMIKRIMETHLWKYKPTIITDIGNLLSHEGIECNWLKSKKPSYLWMYEQTVEDYAEIYPGDYNNFRKNGILNICFSNLKVGNKIVEKAKLLNLKIVWSGDISQAIRVILPEVQIEGIV